MTERSGGWEEGTGREQPVKSIDSNVHWSVEFVPREDVCRSAARVQNRHRVNISQSRADTGAEVRRGVVRSVGAGWPHGRCGGGTESSDGSRMVARHDERGDLHRTRGMGGGARAPASSSPSGPGISTGRDPSTFHAGDWAAIGHDGSSLPVELDGPQPVEAYVRRAGREPHGSGGLAQRAVAQAPAAAGDCIEDPVASNVVFPIPAAAPQYSLMGYNPYNLTLAQQFPWFGTLRLRGEAAQHDVHVASRSWRPRSSMRSPP